MFDFLTTMGILLLGGAVLFALAYSALALWDAVAGTPKPPARVAGDDRRAKGYEP